MERDFFAQFKELTPAETGPSTWTRYDSFAFARPYVTVPLSWTELHRAAAHLPLCLALRADTLRLEALLHFGPDGTGVVDDKDQWRAGYVPALLRLHPFAPDLSAQPQAREYVAKNSPHVLPSSGGLPFFAPDGGPSPELRSVQTVLKEFCREAHVLQQAALPLRKGKLLRPLRALPALDDALFDDLYVIDRPSLYNLTAPRMLKLMQTGGLELAFAQLISMQRLSAAPLQAPAPPQKSNTDTADTFLSAMASAFATEASEIQYDELDRP
jgi:hypothetical protein